MNIEDKSIPLTLREQSEEWYDKEANMCEELEAMIDFGNKAARALCGHLADMKAAKATIPITLNHDEYVVTVEIVKKANGTCPKCGQTDIGQYGEYPCEVCGLPTLFDPPANARIETPTNGVRR